MVPFNFELSRYRCIWIVFIKESFSFAYSTKDMFAQLKISIIQTRLDVLGLDDIGKQCGKIICSCSFCHTDFSSMQYYTFMYRDILCYT